MAPWHSRDAGYMHPHRAHASRPGTQPLPHWLEPGNTLGDMLAAQKAQYNHGENVVLGSTADYTEAASVPFWNQDCHTVIESQLLERNLLESMPFHSSNGYCINPEEQSGAAVAACSCPWASSPPWTEYDLAYPPHPIGMTPHVQQQQEPQQQHNLPPGDWYHPPTNGHFLNSTAGASGDVPLSGSWNVSQQHQQDNVAATLGLLAPSAIRSSALPSTAVAPASCRDERIVLPPYIQIRNTFLNARPIRSPSMERVYVERKVRSMPSSRPASIPPGGSLEVCDVEPPFAITTPSGSSIFTTPPQTPPPMMQGFSHSRSSSSADPYLASSNSNMLGSKGLSQWEQQQQQLEETAAAPSPPTPAPSRGSTLHQFGACKPCAFFVKDSCSNGDDCQFCHLCEPGEKKRRKKERMVIRREMRERIRGHRWMH